MLPQSNCVSRPFAILTPCFQSLLRRVTLAPPFKLLMRLTSICYFPVTVDLSRVLEQAECKKVRISDPDPFWARYLRQQSVFTSFQTRKCCHAAHKVDSEGAKMASGDAVICSAKYLRISLWEKRKSAFHLQFITSSNPTVWE